MQTGVTYSITLHSTGAVVNFAVALQPQDTMISLAASLDFEVTPNYLFTISAVDKDPLNPLTGTTQVTVIVQNVNDLPPVINPLTTIVVLSEEDPADTTVQSYTCTDGVTALLFLYPLVQCLHRSPLTAMV